MAMYGVGCTLAADPDRSLAEFTQLVGSEAVMVRSRSLSTAVCALLLFSLSACPTGQANVETQADFYVSLTGQGGVGGYVPMGYYWKPNSKVEISIFNEPDGPGSASAVWKKILDENVDANSMFGFSSGAPFYPVRRSICGTPENGQMVLFMSKNLTTGAIRMRQVPADIYFTFQPCG